MIVAIVSLLVVMAISLLTMRLAAMALILTGMSREAARFQACSALTGVGFTTKESESVVNHPVRRRIIMLLMLLGSIGVPTIIASLVVSVITTVQTVHWWKPMCVLVGGLTTLLIIARSRWAEKQLNKCLAWALKRWTNLDARDYVSLLNLQNGYAVTEMIVKPSDWLRKKPSGCGAFARGRSDPGNHPPERGIYRRSGSYRYDPCPRRTRPLRTYRTPQGT